MHSTLFSYFGNNVNWLMHSSSFFLMLSFSFLYSFYNRQKTDQAVIGHSYSVKNVYALILAFSSTILAPLTHEHEPQDMSHRRNLG